MGSGTGKPGTEKNRHGTGKPGTEKMVTARHGILGTETRRALKGPKGPNVELEGPLRAPRA